MPSGNVVRAHIYKQMHIPHDVGHQCALNRKNTRHLRRKVYVTQLALNQPLTHDLPGTRSLA